MCMLRYDVCFAIATAECSWYVPPPIISNAARMRVITTRFSIKVGSTAVLALGGIPVRSFHIATNTNANHAASAATAPAVAAAFQGAGAAQWATLSRPQARTTTSASAAYRAGVAGQMGKRRWGTEERGRSRLLADRTCVTFDVLWFRAS